MADCRETVWVQDKRLDTKTAELLTFKKRSSETIRSLKSQRDVAFDAKATALDDKELLFKSAEKERDTARKEIHALNDKKRISISRGGMFSI